MPRPSSHLDAYLLVPDTLSLLDARARFDAIQAETDDICRQVTFANLRFDDPGRPTLYANRQGGFHVRCPCGAGLGARFQPHGRTVCTTCERSLRWNDVEARPPLGVARAAIVLVDVDHADFGDLWPVVLSRR